MVQKHSGFELKLSEAMHLPIASLTTDHSYFGITTTATAGEILVFGEVCYMKAADGRFWKADANAVATMPVSAMALASIAAAASGLFLLIGLVRDDSWSALTIGGICYGSSTAVGQITQTAPVGSGDQVQVVGLAYTAVVVWFNPSFELVEIA